MRAQEPAGTFRAGASCVLTGVQEGGVLKMRSGSVKFESVAISDTRAGGVRVAGEADRAGGGLGWRCCSLRLYDTCLRGQWEGPCCTRMLRMHGVRCM
jgi:hypothetical protein